MSAETVDHPPDRRRGWCPTLHAPMRSGDGLLLRVNPAAGRFDARALRRLLAAAARHGNGMVELTARARLQFRGFDERGALAFAEAAVAAGLGAADSSAERRRGVMVSPLAGLDPDCDAGTLQLAAALEAAVAADVGGLDGLPEKASLLVDGGGAMPLHGIGATVALRARGGRWGVEHENDRMEPGRDGMLAAALATLRMVAARGDRAAAAPGPIAAGAPATAPRSVGPLPFGAFGVGVPTGWLDRRRLDRLAAAAADAGDGALRPTPWRSLVLGGLGTQAAAALVATLDGAVTDPADPRLRVSCCVGAPRCGSGLMPASADAAGFAAAVPPGTTLHVSGCAKGCASPRAATLTLVGGANGYDAVWHGRPGDPPRERGLDVPGAAELVGRAA